MKVTSSCAFRTRYARSSAILREGPAPLRDEGERDPRLSYPFHLTYLHLFHHTRRISEAVSIASSALSRVSERERDLEHEHQ